MESIIMLSKSVCPPPSPNNSIYDHLVCLWSSRLYWCCCRNPRCNSYSIMSYFISACIFINVCFGWDYRHQENYCLVVNVWAFKTDVGLALSPKDSACLIGCYLTLSRQCTLHFLRIDNEARRIKEQISHQNILTFGSFFGIVTVWAVSHDCAQKTRDGQALKLSRRKQIRQKNWTEWAIR